MNLLPKTALLAATLSLGACTVLEADKVDYRSSSSVKPPPALVVPPDLTQLSKESHYAVKGGTVSASDLRSGQTDANGKQAAVAVTSVGDVRFERAANQRWLVVGRPAEKLWDPIKSFWQDNGFVLTMEQNELGIMETDWAENRAKLPQDFIRASLGKLLDTLYSTGERDKFRTRLERNAKGETEIFISHRGMVETYTSERKDNTVWQPRAADPELETEFLRRLMVKLGVTQKDSTAMVATNNGVKQLATITTENGQPAVRIEEGFDFAWRRVGLALDRTGFTVEDRDRTKGVYFVRYVPVDTDNKERGFFANLFSGSSAKSGEAEKFQITLRSQSGTTLSTLVFVLDAKGNPETTSNAQRIMKIIADDIQ